MELPVLESATTAIPDSTPPTCPLHDSQIEAPEPGEYETTEEALEEMQAFAESKGFRVKKEKSRTVGNKKGASVKNLDLLCEHAGNYKAKNTQVRNTTSSRTE